MRKRNKINFTLKERKRLGRAKILLSEIDECSINDILKAISPTKERAQEIEKKIVRHFLQAY